MEIQETLKKSLFHQKERRNIKPIKTSSIKMEHYKTSELLDDSTVSKFVTKKWIKINDFQVVNILLTKYKVYNLNC